MKTNSEILQAQTMTAKNFWSSRIYSVSQKTPTLKQHSLHYFRCLVWKTKSWQKSKPTQTLKHTNSNLEYFEYFCQMSSKLILIILSYTVSKLVRFWDTVYSGLSYHMHGPCAHPCTMICQYGLRVPQSHQTCHAQTTPTDSSCQDISTYSLLLLRSRHGSDTQVYTQKNQWVLLGKPDL